MWLATEDGSRCRDGRYITFHGEDESDYAEGPVRMVFASNGVKQCGALFMTLPLSSKLQRASRAQRDFNKARRLALRKSKVYLNLNSQLIK